jgi:predicted RNA-binding Zn-ribbon protein involved in translation (DUF1610 family)
MQQYRVHCHSCGTVQVMARDIELAGETYVFDCPICGGTVSQPASHREIELLRRHGTAATLRTSSLWPALTLDDVIAFHEQLEDEHTIEAFLRQP